MGIGNGNLDNFIGVNIVASGCIPDYRPKQTLSLKVTVSDEFRTNFDNWLKDFFGMEPNIYMVSGTILCSPRTHKVIKEGLQTVTEDDIRLLNGYVEDSSVRDVIKSTKDFLDLMYGIKPIHGDSRSVYRSWQS